MAAGEPEFSINAVCAHLGVTRGSFYWHFRDLDDLVVRVTQRWCAVSVAALDELAHSDGVHPPERLRAMTLRLLDPRTAAVERTLRAWARTDRQVAALVADTDLTVFGVVHGALVEMGRSAEDARALAGVLVYAGIGFAHGHHGLPQPTTAEVDRLLALLR
jgi:AcrR family transcriptional regulator